MAENDNQTTADRGAIAPESPPGDSPGPRRRLLVRRLLLLLGPLLVAAIGGYVYLTSGRYSATDNAYVKADKVAITTEVAGVITDVRVEENQKVAAGDVLFTIDDSGYRLAVSRGNAQLQAVGALLESQRVAYAQRLAEIDLARTNAAFAERELAREVALEEQDLGLEADVDSARHDLEVARQQVHIAEQSLEQLRLQLGGDPTGDVTKHPGYRAIEAMRDSAVVDLKRTIVRAPLNGVAGNVPVPGHYAAPGAPVMAVVSDSAIWIEANYKETDLTYVNAGQDVSIRVDTYPDREWRGKVSSIGQATGAEFSVIPPQNATGNWVKVTQRIPVRIAVEISETDPPLRAGMSAEVTIDTGHQRRLPSWLGFVRHPDRQTTAVSITD